jgi:hypothetical protein
VVSKNLATDAEFGISECGQLNDKRPPALAGGLFLSNKNLYSDIFTDNLLSPQPPVSGEANSRLLHYEAIAATFAEPMDVEAVAGCGRIERNHPAESQERGIENSDQPQSRHTKTSGDGVIGGWLRVRWQFL